jgi:hypothetical protein
LKKHEIGRAMSIWQMGMKPSPPPLRGVEMPNQPKMRDLPVDQVPAVYHRRLGDLVVSTVSDGYLDPPRT